MRFPKVSIIVPLYKKTPYFYETIGRCLELDCPDFEVLIGVDGKTGVGYRDRRIKVLRTNSARTGPAEKRDIGIRKATGAYVAFLDDDSYPASDWLKKAVVIINKKKLDVVVGPGLTPPHDSFSQKITGAILSSKLGSGPYSYRFTKERARYVDDYPAYNMVVSKEALKRVGGFATKFYGGEDTALCLKLINAGYKIYYHPDIVVYHHRRRFPFEYLRQVGNVGLHRGYFVRAYPQTSLRPSYFAPAVATAAAAALLAGSLVSLEIFLLSSFLLALFYVIVFFVGTTGNSFWISLFFPLALLINYLSYGVNFIKGLFFTNKLER